MTAVRAQTGRAATVRALALRLLDLLPRPLDPVRSIKMKLGIALLTSGAAGLTVFWYGIGWVPYVTSLTAIAVALVTSQVLAHGMTSPLRQMTAAARAMATGDYSRRVRVTSRDEVGELGRAFNLMAADLEAADQYRRELIANVSHELRTPISALQAVLENVVDGVAEPDADTLRTALTQTERLGRLVAELLDLSRLDGGVLALTSETFEVLPFLDGVVAQSQIAGHPGVVTVDVDPPQLTAVADPARLHQVVANLLDNAARHGPRGGRITVRARRAVTAGGLLLEVADEGPGIPPDQREAVFERFIRGAGSRAAGARSAGVRATVHVERASGAGTQIGAQAGARAAGPDGGGVAGLHGASLRGAGTHDGGTGLGLAIARWAVDLHGGTIAVVGDGPGCRIRVILPPPT